MCVYESDISRDFVSRFEVDDISGDELFSWNGPTLFSPLHQGLGSQHTLNAFQGLFRLALLDEPDERIDHSHTENNRSVQPLLEQGSDHGCSEQDIDEHIVELECKSGHWPFLFGLSQLVGSEGFKPLFCVFFTEACVQTVKFVQYFLHRSGMPHTFISLQKIVFRHESEP